MAQVNVAIIGLGKLGTSFGLALRALNKPEARHQFRVTGHDRVSARQKAATKLEALDLEAGDYETAVQGADLVVLASPYRDAKEIMEIIGPVLKSGAVVMDASPLKRPSLDWARKFFRRDANQQPDAYLVGVTPIINPEYLGDPTDDPANARADLFQKGTMILSPAPDCPPEAVQLVSDLTDLLGVKVHFLDPEEHDGMIAAMENLPTLLQLGLFESLTRASSWSDMQWLSNPAFFLATYQLSDAEAESLALTLHRNSANLVRRLDALIESLTNLRSTLREADEIPLAEHFNTAINQYAEWEGQRLANRWRSEPAATDEMRSGFSLMGGLFPTFGGRGKKKDKGGK